MMNNDILTAMMILRDANAHMMRTLTFCLDNDTTISDDDTDYLDADRDLISMLTDAITDDNDELHCAALMHCFASELMPLDAFANCIHDLAIDFDSPILDAIIPDYDDCTRS